MHVGTGKKSSRGEVAAIDTGRLEDRPEASSPLICVRMERYPQPDFCADSPPIHPRFSRLSPLPFPVRHPPLTSPVGAWARRRPPLSPGAGPGRTGSARIWVSGTDNLQREIEWSTPITVPGCSYLPTYLPSRVSAARIRGRRRRRCRKRIAGPPRHYSDSLSSLPAATSATDRSGERRGENEGGRESSTTSCTTAIVTVSLGTSANANLSATWMDKLGNGSQR